MRKINLTLNTYDWRKNRQTSLAAIEKEITILLDDINSGCFVVTLNGPMNGEEAEKFVKSQSGNYGFEEAFNRIQLPKGVQLYDIQGQTVFPTWMEGGYMASKYAFFLVKPTMNGFEQVRVEIGYTPGRSFVGVTQAEIDAAIKSQAPHWL